MHILKETFFFEDDEDSITVLEDSLLGDSDDDDTSIVDADKWTFKLHDKAINCLFD
jgi:hypothetical protein